MLTLTTPGPSPWYLRAPWARVSTVEGDWSWEAYDGPDFAGLSRLLSPSRETMLFVDFYCYVQPLPDARLLIWYEPGRQKPSNPLVVFALIDLRALEALDDPAAIARDVKAKKEHVHFKGEGAVFWEFSTALDAGTHPISVPAPLRELTETLVLADYGRAGQSSNHFDQMYRAIFAFDFQSGRVSVIPQRWFNEGNYDFGYQWIVRVQREVGTRKIFGEGIRLGSFRLNEAGTEVEEWFAKDQFYHPEQDV
jgi:hypothetical protein